MQEVLAVYTQRALAVIVRAYGTRRGGLAEHIEEAIESALRVAGAGPAGISFDRDEDTRLSDQLFRARRAGHDGIAIRLTALRALCAPVGGLDAADAQTVAFYMRAAAERPIAFEMDDADKTLPAFVVARPLDEVLRGEPEMEPEPEAEAVAETATEAEAEPEPEFDPRWREHVSALEAARGPQTLASFERLFVHSYLPLASAVDAGLGERAADLAREEFRRTFARAYADALPTFVLTGKRPRMVLDAYDIASKMARAHGARNAQVLLVDGMRYDVAARVVTRVAALSEGRAALVDRVTLFSALPSSTPRQLESLARGVEALRSAHDERDPEPMRDRTADTVRRMRIGSRDLFKLDSIETSLAAAGDAAHAALEDVSEDAARAIAKHLRAQGDRTLLFVFGDHGFRFERGAAKHGGASPEEVIVSGHAFLVGDLH
ncbi:MAG TPA: hypothetical protein VGH28_04790 [Polyangiaceae bacterium]|jgi:hypothetical protein